MKHSVICHEILSLPFQERAKLAEQLLSSLDEPSEMETERFWFQEAEWRATELSQNNVQRIPSEEVQLEAQKLLE